MKTFNNIIEEGIFTTRPDDVTNAAVMDQVDKLKKYNSQVNYLQGRRGISAGEDVFGNKLQQGDWCLMPIARPIGFEWRIALIMDVKGKLIPVSFDPSKMLANKEVQPQYHRGIGTRDCIKIDDIEKFMKNL